MERTRIGWKSYQKMRRKWRREILKGGLEQPTADDARVNVGDDEYSTTDGRADAVRERTPPVELLLNSAAHSRRRLRDVSTSWLFRRRRIRFRKGKQGIWLRQGKYVNSPWCSRLYSGTDYSWISIVDWWYCYGLKRFTFIWKSWNRLKSLRGCCISWCMYKALYTYTVQLKKYL